MSRRTHAPLRRFAVLGVPALLLGLVTTPATGASAASGGDGDVDVANTETVQVKMDADGAIDTQRVYEQLALTGDGTVDLENPISNNRLRNLDGFGGGRVRDGAQRVRTEVDGSERLRSVSNYTKDLPLRLDVSYRLDGKPVEASDVVGRTGELEVRYRVENVTGRRQSVTYTDGQGNPVSKQADVVVPMVGTLVTTAPASFTDVRSAQANAAGDGRGGTRLSFTMTLFPPIGSPTAEFGYTAHVRDGVVPDATVSALPVDPLQSPSFKGGAASYKSGADTGATLTAGATTIDDNLLRLRDGAAELLAGLVQLRDGSDELAKGLGDRAVPGSRRAADGARQIADGAGRLDRGARQAADGAGKLDDGAKRLRKGAGVLDDGLGTAEDKAPQLVDGLEQVGAGLDRVDAGLAKLGGNVGAGGEQLAAGITRLRAGIGERTDTPGEETLLGGVNGLRAGISDQIVPGLSQILAQLPKKRDQLRCAELVLRDLTSDDAARNTPSACSPLAATISSLPRVDPASYGLVLGDVANGLERGHQGLIRPPGGGLPAPTLQEGLQQIRGGLTTQVLPGLTRLGCGLDNTYAGACDDEKAGLMQGLALVDAGVGRLVDGVVAGVGTGRDTPADETLRGGVNGLQAGNDKIAAGGQSLLDGLGKLGDGAGQLSAGAGRLSDGTGRLADGSARLADGAGRLSDGAGRLDEGLAGLVDGLVDAASGAARIADGNEQAAAGAPRIVDGAGELSEKGTSKLVEAGERTADDYGLKYALIEAGAKRAGTAMAYGAPKGATGRTAYTYQLAAADGEGSKNVVRGVAGLLVFAAAGGIAFARRRLRT